MKRRALLTAHAAALLAANVADLIAAQHAKGALVGSLDARLQVGDELTDVALLPGAAGPGSTADDVRRRDRPRQRPDTVSVDRGYNHDKYCKQVQA